MDQYRVSKGERCNMMQKIAEWFDICKVHWKEIFALSFIMHFVFDIFIFWAGFLVGRLF